MDRLLLTNEHDDGGPGGLEKSHPQGHAPSQPDPSQPGPGQHTESQHTDGQHGLKQSVDRSSPDPLDDMLPETEEAGPRPPRPDEPGPEQARRWRFDRPAGRGARGDGAPRVAGSSSPGTAMVPSGYDWTSGPSSRPAGT